MEQAKLVKNEAKLYFPSWLIFATRYEFTDGTIFWDRFSDGNSKEFNYAESEYNRLIDKPVETTNEQPNKYDLKEIFEEQTEEIKDNYGYMHKHFTPLATHI